MDIVLTGLSHKTAPVDIRERVAIAKGRLQDALSALANRTGGGVVLSTCNRMEIYSVSEDPHQTNIDVQHFISEFHRIAPIDIEPHMYTRSKSRAVHHLFRVASGLDSMVLGESEILGQVREALTSASDSGYLSGPASRLFHRAIRTGRMVRDETDLGRNPLSISYAAVQLAQQVLGGLTGKKVLLIGAGDTGQLVAKALITSGAGEIMIANRTLSKSEDLSLILDGNVVIFEEIVRALDDVDIVIVATDAPEYVLKTSDIAAVVNGRRGRHVFLFDLSVPRNIDPDVSGLDSATLFNIDDLLDVSEKNFVARQSAAGDAERIVEREVERFMGWWTSLGAVPVIKALRRQAEHVRSRELDRALDKLSGLSTYQTECIDVMTRSIVNRLLHYPTASLKRESSETLLASVRELFNLHEFVPEQKGDSNQANI